MNKLNIIVPLETMDDVEQAFRLGVNMEARTDNKELDIGALLEDSKVAKRLMVSSRSENTSRFGQLEDAIERNAAYVDLRLDKDNESRIRYLTKLPRKNTRIIGSYHIFNDVKYTEMKESVSHFQEKSLELGCDIYKFAVSASVPTVYAWILNTVKDSKSPIAGMPMGKEDLTKFVRVVSGLVGSEFIFCRLKEGSAKGQPFVKDAGQYEQKLKKEGWEPPAIFAEKDVNYINDLLSPIPSCVTK